MIYPNIRIEGAILSPDLLDHLEDAPGQRPADFGLDGAPPRSRMKSPEPGPMRRIIFAHGSGFLPPNQHFVEITLPKGVSYEFITPAILPGWDDASATTAKAFGERWQRELRSLLLLVPSFVARIERNVLINPDHPEFSMLTTDLAQPVWWDARLFKPAESR